MQSRLLSTLLLLITFDFCQGQHTASQDADLKDYLEDCAYKHHYTSQNWDDCINLGLKLDSTSALLWQLKALPYWKTKKYDLAVACYDKAVQYDRQHYLGRRGYLKCVFKRDYLGAIKDMEAAEKEFGYAYQNDHSYQFYIALCYLQMNKFQTARQFLENDINRMMAKHGEEWVHHLDMFYMGIIHYELRDHEKAILYFDKALAKYSNFSDVQYYKGLCLLKKGDNDSGKAIMSLAKSNYEKGYKINEDDALYETYPYEVNWNMAKWTIPGYKE